jgi:ankyrin repeat protein
MKQKRNKKHEQSYREQHQSAIRREQEQHGSEDPISLLMNTAISQDKGFLEYLAQQYGINIAQGGKTALFWIAGTEHVAAAKLLVAVGASVELSVLGAASPLMHAAFRSQLDMAAYLISIGADPDYTDANGESARNIAQAGGYTELIDLMR